jgi:hypothetical protein
MKEGGIAVYRGEETKKKVTRARSVREAYEITLLSVYLCIPLVHIP